MEYVPRYADAQIQRVLGISPAVLLLGPRTVGKTTTARRVAHEIVALDRPAQAQVFEADPDAALSAGERPLLIDEWQAVPSVLGAVKRAVDHDSWPGQFVLTGSVRGDLDTATWPGTGRLIRLPMHPLSVRELLRGPLDVAPFLERVMMACAGQEMISVPTDTPDLVGYIDLLTRGGLPPAALTLDGDDRLLWYHSYLDQLTTRDASLVEPRRDPARLRSYLEATALHSAEAPAHKVLYDAAGIERLTAAAYDDLLSELFVLEPLPAWSSNRLKRLTRTPKRHFVEPALAVAALGLSASDILADAGLLGRFLESFVVTQIRADLDPTRPRPELFHLRDQASRHEIDLLAELPGGDLVAIEIKATAAPKKSQTAHLDWLRDQLGPRVVASVLLHTGPRPFWLGETLAAPISSIWA